MGLTNCNVQNIETTNLSNAEVTLFQYGYIILLWHIKPQEMSMICICGMARNNDSKKFNEIASNCN